MHPGWHHCWFTDSSCGPGDLDLLATATSSALPAAAATEEPVRRDLGFKGVAYDTGTGFLGDDIRVRWRNNVMREEIRAIGDRLHANWVSIYGSNVKRLTDTATEALRQGLRVSIQTRSFDEPQADALEKLRRTARDAERLRCRYQPEVILVIGCEFILFTPGITPGANFFERAEYLTKGGYDMAELQLRRRHIGGSRRRPSMRYRGSTGRIDRATGGYRSRLAKRLPGVGRLEPTTEKQPMVA